MPRVRKRLLAGLGILALVLAACGPAATATPPPTSPPTAVTAPRATATPAPGVVTTPAPTAVPGSPPAAAPTTAGPKYGGVLRHRILRDVESWDPGRDWSAIGEVSLWTYPRLFSYFRGGPDAQPCQIYPIQPELATGFKWVDDTTLDVAIRQGVKLPQTPPLNGREVTAEDVAFTFNRMFFGSKLAPVQGLAALTESVTAVDKYTARFKLKSPHSEYVEVALAYFDTPILPPETLDKPGDPTARYQWEGYQAGAYGRFRPTRWSPGVSIEMERNPNFFMQGLPYLDGVSILVIGEETTFTAALRGRRLDSGLSRFADNIADMLRMKDLPLEVCPAASKMVAQMNTRMPPFDDVNVRRAVSMAIDREAMNKVAFQGLGTGPFTVLTDVFGRDWSMELEDYPPEVRRYLTYDVKAAKETLAKSASPTGATSKIIYWPQQAGSRQVGEAITSMVDDVGIVLKIEEVTREVYSGIYGEFPYDKPAGRHTGMILGLIAWAAIDQIVEYHQSTNNRNRSAIKDPKLDAMLEEQRRTLDVGKRQQLIKAIQTYIVDQMYVLPLPTGPFAQVHQPSVKGIYFRTYGWYDGEPMRDVWLDR